MRPTLHENRLYSIAAADEAIATRAMCDASMETSSSHGFSPCLWMNVLCLWVAWIASKFGKQVVKSDQSEQRIQNNLSYTFCSCCWLAECWWRGINSAASCQCRCVDASTNIKQRKRLLQLLNQNSAANIPYDGENRTSSTDNRILYRRSNFLRRRGSETDRRRTDRQRRWTQHERLWRRTGRRNPISDGVRSRAPSSVEIQNKAGSSFLIAGTAASFACKCSQITTAEEAERKVEQRRGCISQFSVNSDDDVVAFQLNIYNTKYCDKKLLTTLYGK